MVGSLVVGEVVNRTSSFIISKHKERLTTWEGIERLEMAHIKMEAALDISGRWQTTDVSLLRWRRKLRRAADDCDAALHRWKLRALEEEAARERLAREPFRRRVAHAVLSFVRALLALTRGGNDVVARACAAVQRFERLANGSAEFLKCVELSSASRRCCLSESVWGKPVTGMNEDIELEQTATYHIFSQPIAFSIRPEQKVSGEEDDTTKDDQRY
ncbi:hypothetical protein PR202_ga31038 [Eleusine coracana subsp. coracana]|uniref:Disease resistance N-terminal domain-containing protein n=1 Tax=Eleusine coracana subsp. coracana TaxID=191504 RepID=A0AAV5DRJ4_ELECO|nr:hypothetical protein PR202_ga31038 [Eleusine coracana subsp. coracana]